MCIEEKLHLPRPYIMPRVRAYKVVGERKEGLYGLFKTAEGQSALLEQYPVYTSNVIEQQATQHSVTAFRYLKHARQFILDCYEEGRDYDFAIVKGYAYDAFDTYIKAGYVGGGEHVLGCSLFIMDDIYREPIGTKHYYAYNVRMQWLYRFDSWGDKARAIGLGSYLSGVSAKEAREHYKRRIYGTSWETHSLFKDDTWISPQYRKSISCKMIPLES